MPNSYISTIQLPNDETAYFIKDAEAREELNDKIDNPSQKSNGQILTYNGASWVASDPAPSGVISVTGDSVVSASGTSNVTLTTNITGTQGNVTLSKETDGLKANVADSALSIAKTNGLQTALDAKQTIANKVNSWQTTPDNNHYPSELLVKTETDNIRAVAEGKTKTYIINAKTDITGTEDANGNFTNVTAITGVTLANLKLGDNVLIKAIDVPDYWVSQITPSVSLNKLETSKIDLTQYVSKAEAGDLAYKDNASGSFTPNGTVSTPTITVTPSTSNIYEITGVGSTPSWSASVDSTTEILSFSWSAGSTPSRQQVQVATGISSATSSQPNFTGTQATITVE